MKREPHKAMTSGLNYGQAMWVVGVKGVFKAGGLTPRRDFSDGTCPPTAFPEAGQGTNSTVTICHDFAETGTEPSLLTFSARFRSSFKFVK